jgi:hypothetical protein
MNKKECGFHYVSSDNLQFGMTNIKLKEIIMSTVMSTDVN